MAVLRDVGEPVDPHLDRIIAGHFGSPEHDRAVIRFSQPGDGFDQFGLPVPFDAGESNDLACPNDILRLSTALRAPLPRTIRLNTCSADSPGLRWRPIDRQQHVAPDHQFCQLGRIGFSGDSGSNRPAAPNHRHAIANRRHLTKLVGDEDDRFPSIP